MILDSIQLPEHVTEAYHHRIVVATGHRPNKCGGYGEAAQIRLKQTFNRLFTLTLMDQKRTQFGFPRTTCSCSACANNCRNLPGMLIPDDVPRIARHLGYTDVMEFARENLLASPGAIVLRDNQQERIPTLVPQRGADGACRFLNNDLCTIHTVSPYGCAFFSEHEDRAVADKKSILGLVHITRDHQTNGRYSRIWSMLDSANLRAIRPETIRQRMNETPATAAEASNRLASTMDVSGTPL